MATAFQPMPIQDDAQTVHTSMRVGLYKRIDALVQWAAGFITEYGYGFAVDLMRTGKLALDDFTATTGGISKTHRSFHCLTPGAPKLKGSAQRVFAFWVLVASSGGRTICTVVLPSLPL